MNQFSSNIDSTNSDSDDSAESDQSSQPSKRLCQSSDSKTRISDPSSSSSVLINSIPDDVKDNKDECKSCGKQEILLKTFNCPSLHHFCLNCIFNWTKKHIQTKTPPICLVVGCEYLLKDEDLDDLPITINDHRILLQLIQINLNKHEDGNDFRCKCDKCCLYIDQHDFFIHHNQCLGREITIPCEICYCPILMNDYEEHMLCCTNDDNKTLAKFVCKHIQNPKIDEKLIEFFVSSWQRKHLRAIDVYEIIEELNQTNGISKEICDICKNSATSNQFYFIHCYDNHSLCFLCYKQRLQNQMNNNEVLTCHQCTYHLQDKDLSQTSIFNEEEIILFQNYQNVKVCELYNNLYGTKATLDTDPQSQALQQQHQQQNEQIPKSNESTARRTCELCFEQHSYANIFVLNCNCKICYNCFANDINRQRTTTNELLRCSFCRSPIKHNDLSNLHLPADEIRDIQSYQQGKLFETEHALHINPQNNSEAQNDRNNEDDDDDFDVLLLSQQHYFPQYWTLPMLTNFSRHTLDQQSTEYKFVAERFDQSFLNFNRERSGRTHATKNERRAHSRPTLPLTQQQHLIQPPSTLQPTQPESLVKSTQLTPSLKSAHPHPIARMLQNIQSTPSVTQPPTNPSSIFVSVINNNVIPNTTASLSQRFQSARSSTSNNNNNDEPTTNQQMQSQVSRGLPSSMLSGTNSMASQTSRSRDPSETVSSQLHHTRNTFFTPTGGLLSSQIVNTPSTTSLPHPSLFSPITLKPEIIQIERIQNQRWYKQYSAHKYEFRQKLGKHTEQWLFHGCDEQSSKNIEVEWFNRSYAGQHASAYGQGCYFARDSSYSHTFALPNRNGIRRMFLARVLIGNTTQGNSTMRVPPSGFDTTGDGQNIFVTYHDSQAYGEYLLSYRC